MLSKLRANALPCGNLYGKVPSSLSCCSSLDLFFNVQTCGSDVLCMHPALARKRQVALCESEASLHSTARQPKPHSETMSKNTPPTHTHKACTCQNKKQNPNNKAKPKQQGVNMLGRAGHVAANCPVITKLSLKCSQPSETLNRAATYHKQG